MQVNENMYMRKTFFYIDINLKIDQFVIILLEETKNAIVWTSPVPTNVY